MEANTRRCYYDILGVDRKCDEKTLKKKYRKLALKFHPDKAPRGEEEQYTVKFQELNEAYEVLSNPNEKAWYDAHREQILTGKSKEEMESQSGFGFDIDQYLKDDCYSGKDFYEVFNEVFMKIKIEEEKAKELNDIDRQSPLEMTNFGDASSDESMIKNFYLDWENFSSCKTFAFADMYNPKDYEGRRIKRLIDRENKKVRNEARKQYISKIKQLVGFVKSRDSRWAEMVHKENLKRKKQEQLNKIEEIRKEKEWQEKKKRLLEEEMKNYGEYIEEEEDIALTNLEEFFCRVCNKEFKTEGALRHHNKSKQHLKRKKKIMEELMLEGDEEMLKKLEQEIEESEKKYQVEEKVKPVVLSKKSKKKKRKKRKNNQMNLEEQNQNESELVENKVEQKEEEEKDTNTNDKLMESNVSNQEFEMNSTKGNKKKRRRRKKKQTPKVQVEVKQEDETKFLSKKMKRKLKKKQKEEKNNLTCRECKKEFETRNNLFSHLREIHKFKW
jgi:DnaJ family protein A protein 5